LKKDKPFRVPKTEASTSTSATSGGSGSNTIKVKWSKKKVYTKEDVEDFFSRFGNIDLVIMAEDKKKGRPSALISFKNPLDAVCNDSHCNSYQIITSMFFQQTTMQSKVDGYVLSWPSKQPQSKPTTTPTPAPNPIPFQSPFATNYQSPFASSVGAPFDGHFRPVRTDIASL
jgi:hypothetical protein